MILAAERDVVQEVGQLARGFGILALLLEDEALDGADAGGVQHDLGR